MASGFIRRTLQLSLVVVSRRQNGLFTNRFSHRKINSSVLSLQKYFSEKHEWIDIPDGSSEGTVGITDYAQDKLGEVVFVQLPEIGQALEKDGEAGVLESVKAASDVYSPVSGDVTDINGQLNDNPSLINSSPYGEGWLYRMTISDTTELEDLMNDDAYQEFLKSEAE